jgi:hypothetical protein
MQLHWQEGHLSRQVIGLSEIISGIVPVPPAHEDYNEREE